MHHDSRAKYTLPVVPAADTAVSPHLGSPSAPAEDIPPRTAVPPVHLPPTEPAPRRYPTWRVALICLALTAGAAAVLIPIVHSAWEAGGDSSSSLGQALGGILLQGGLPPTGDASPGDGSSSTDDPSSADEPSSTDEPTSGDDFSGTEDATSAWNTEPSTDASGGDPTETLPGGTEPNPTDSLPVALPDPAESTEPDTAPSESDTYPESDTDASAEDTAPSTDAETESEIPAETQPTPVPEGCFPIVGEDKSEPDRPVGYIINSTGESLPVSIPGEGTRLWSTAETPTVLMVHTHPYEGYSDGGEWYDPTDGPLAQTNSTSATDGVVALGARLTSLLRERGVKVIHLRVPVTEGESAASTYERAAAMVDYYCRLYPDIGLVLDLGRSAEMTEEGGILRTEGTLDGETCGQLRLAVHAGRSDASVARDIATAVALRRALGEVSPSISRPVWVKSGTGMAGDLGGVVSLTVEFGSAGNTFAEAERLLVPLSDAISELVLAK